MNPAVRTAAPLALLVLDGLLLGAVGLAFTPLHAGPVPVPLGAVMSAVILPWLVLRAGELDPRPPVAAAPLVAWVVAVAGLGLGGPGGDMMLPVTWQSLLLVVGGLAAGLRALRAVLMTEAGRTDDER